MWGSCFWFCIPLLLLLLVVTHHLCHTSYFTHHLSHTQLCHTQLWRHTHNFVNLNFVTHHLSFTPSFTHNFVTHNFATHNFCYTQLCHAPSFPHHLSHTHNFVTHNFVTRNFVKHNFVTHNFHTHTQLCHTQLCHNYTTLSHSIFHRQLCHTPSFIHNCVTHTHHLSHTAHTHTQLCHTRTRNFLTHNFVTHHLSHTIFVTHHLSHTTLSHTIFVTHHLSHTTLSHTALSYTTRMRFAWQARHLWHWAGSGGRAWGPLVARGAAALCVASVAVGDIHLHFSGPWRRGTLRGRRGTWRHPPSFHVAGVALGDINFQAWHLWHWAGSGGRAWGPLVARGAAALCVASVAVGDIHLHFSGPWRRGTLRGRRGTWRHPPSFHVAGVALGNINFQAWHLWHWAGSGGALGAR